MSIQRVNNGLDTLSVEQLRGLTDCWTGELLSVDTVEYHNVASERTISSWQQMWHESRVASRDISAEELYGANSELLLERESSLDTLPADTLAGVDIADASIDTLTVSNPVEVVDTVTQVATQSIVWGDVVFNVLVLVATGIYMYSIYRYYEDVVAMFLSVFRSNAIPSHRMSERRQSDLFYGFLGKLLLLGTLFVGLLATGFVLRSGGEDVMATLHQAVMVPLLVIAIFIAVVLAQHLLLTLIGAVTRSGHMVKKILQMRMVYFVFATISVAPLLLLSQMGWWGIYSGWLYVGCGVGIVILALYLKESLELFISKKVSILHWFLYLCTVEVLPLSFLWQLMQGKLGSNF